MDLKSPCPFWPIKNGLLFTYPPLREDVTCDVLILGAGITGAILADRLSREGLNVVVLDRRDAGQGSTSASTAMLQYEIDTHLADLIKKIGREQAQWAYRLCLESIDTLHELAEGSDISCGFQRKTSIYVASRRSDIKALEAEARARRACGINVEFLRQPELGRRYPLPHHAAIVSADAAACDPYRLTHGLLQRAIKNGSRVFDRTEVTKYETGDFGVLAETDRRHRVVAKDIVLATGYEVRPLLGRKVVKLLSTYAFVTQPLESVAPWHTDWLLWESARPYFYMRVTADGRFLVGGEDDRFHNPSLRDARVDRQSKRLLKRLQSIAPDLPLEIEFAWAGTFGETKDGLPFIGAVPDTPHLYVALAFGGNGITFSGVAADILADLLTGRQNNDAAIFRLGR